MRRILLVLTVALVMVAMAASSATAAQPEFLWIPVPNSKLGVVNFFETKAACLDFVATNTQFKACHPFFL